MRHVAQTVRRREPRVIPVCCRIGAETARTQGASTLLRNHGKRTPVRAGVRFSDYARDQAAGQKPNAVKCIVR